MVKKFLNFGASIYQEGLDSQLGVTATFMVSFKVSKQKSIPISSPFKVIKDVLLPNAWEVGFTFYANSCFPLLISCINNLVSHLGMNIQFRNLFLD